MQEKRIEWLDIARGMGIILVVLGHAVSGPVRSVSHVSNIIYNIIYFFHIPLLVFLSGYSYGISQKRYIKKGYAVIKAKFRQLIFPYISYSFFVFICFRIAYLIPTASRILMNSSYKKLTLFQWFKLLVVGYNKYSIHLWYIYALFLMFTITFLVQKILKSYRTVLLIIAIMLYFFAYNCGNITLVISIVHYISLYYIMFILGAYYIQENIIKNKRINIIGIIGLLYAIIVSNSNIEIDNMFGKNILLLMNLIIKIAVVFFICHLSMLARGRLEKLLQYVGRESFGIYMFHQPFCCSGVGMVLCAIGGIPVIVIISCAIFLSFIVPYCIIKILNLDFKICKYSSVVLLGNIK